MLFANLFHWLSSLNTETLRPFAFATLAIAVIWYIYDQVF